MKKRDCHKLKVSKVIAFIAEGVAALSFMSLVCLDVEHNSTVQLIKIVAIILSVFGVAAIISYFADDLHRLGRIFIPLNIVMKAMIAAYFKTTKSVYSDCYDVRMKCSSWIDTYLYCQEMYDRMVEDENEED